MQLVASIISKAGRWSVQPGAVTALIPENMPMLLDTEILRNKLVYMSAGTHTESVAMSLRDFHRLTKAKLTTVSE